MYFNPYDGTLGFVNPYEDRISNPSRIDWNAIINQSFAVGSQAINAYSGAHGGVQVGYNPSQGGVFAIQPSSGYSDSGYGANPYANMTPAQVAAYNSSLGSGVGSGVDGILQWASNNPMIVLGGAVGLYLLFREPPRARR